MQLYRLSWYLKLSCTVFRPNRVFWMFNGALQPFRLAFQHLPAARMTCTACSCGAVKTCVCFCSSGGHCTHHKSINNSGSLCAQVTGNGLSLPACFCNKKEAMSSEGYIVLQMVTFQVTVRFFLPSCNLFLLIFKMFLLGVGISHVRLDGASNNLVQQVSLPMVWNNMIFKDYFNTNHSMIS